MKEFSMSELKDKLTPALLYMAEHKVTMIEYIHNDVWKLKITRYDG